MDLKTKFNAFDKVYYIGTHEGSIAIMESVVIEVVAHAKPDQDSDENVCKVEVSYNLSEGEQDVKEDTLFACVSDLVKHYTDKNNIVCNDPQSIKY